ncbi:hypothetical protein M2158_009199 [Streptomyces sp. SAI-144]|nr:hypothetical protein [Streptomyces sp. SAI-144]
MSSDQLVAGHGQFGELGVMDRVTAVGTGPSAALPDGLSSVRAQRLEPPPVHRPGGQPAIGLGQFGELGVVGRVPTT